MAIALLNLRGCRNFEPVVAPTTADDNNSAKNVVLLLLLLLLLPTPSAEEEARLFSHWKWRSRKRIFVAAVSLAVVEDGASSPPQAEAEATTGTADVGITLSVSSPLPEELRQAASLARQPWSLLLDACVVACLAGWPAGRCELSIRFHSPLLPASNTLSKKNSRIGRVSQ